MHKIVMTKRIPFNVVFVSDEDSDFPSSELNFHNPTVKGWRSKLGSSVLPQEIVLRFQNPAKICRIQVLTHQYLIPEQIELWVHHSSTLTPTLPLNQSYAYLGFISLSDNSSSDYKARELQSVSVTPRIGTHLKLRLGKPFSNHLNTSNQVALVAVNVIGYDVLGTTNKDEVKIDGEDHLVSMCEDLSYSMYIDENICVTIREIELKKTKAVNDERFEYARKLKLCMSCLRSAGERLGRYALAKRQAVEQEDFLTAKLRKEQIELYKNAVFEKLKVNSLLEENGIIQENDLVSELYTQKPILPTAPSLQDIATKIGTRSLSRNSPLKPLAEDKKVVQNSTLTNSKGRSPNRGNSSVSTTGSFRKRNKSAPRTNYEDYEERTVPALRQDCDGNSQSDDTSRNRSRLNDRERRQAALPIIVFGNNMVELFYSRQFQDREEGLCQLIKSLHEKKSVSLIDVNKIARSATLLLHRAVRDVVFSVFNHATKAVRVLFLDFIPGKVSLNEVARSVDRLLPELLSKSGDVSSRIHTLAQHTILSIAACPEVSKQHLVAPSLSRNVGNGTHPRLATSRLQMLEQIVLSQGISNDKQSGLTCRILSECGCSGIHHPAESVRKVAERIILLVYKLNPRIVRKQLPPDDDITRRNLLYRQLFTEFDKLDTQKKTFKSANIESNKSQVEQETNEKYFHNGLLSKKSEEKTDTQYKQVLLKCDRISSTNSESTTGSETDSCDKSIIKHVGKWTMNKLRCPFCDYDCDGGLLLDKHFWKFCPLLTKCPGCAEIMEVSTMTRHLTEDCKNKMNYFICNICTEAIPKMHYSQHKKLKCIPPKKNAKRCPLCHQDVHNVLDSGWKTHLLHSQQCSGNEKRRQLML